MITRVILNDSRFFWGGVLAGMLPVKVSNQAFDRGRGPDAAIRTREK